MSTQLGAGVWKELHRCYLCAKRHYETYFVATTALSNRLCAFTGTNGQTISSKTQREMQTQTGIKRPDLTLSVIGQHGRHFIDTD